jgi:hypothetical protein
LLYSRKTVWVAGTHRVTTPAAAFHSAACEVLPILHMSSQPSSGHCWQGTTHCTRTAAQRGAPTATLLLRGNPWKWTQTTPATHRCTTQYRMIYGYDVHVGLDVKRRGGNGPLTSDGHAWLTFGWLGHRPMFGRLGGHEQLPIDVRPAKRVHMLLVSPELGAPGVLRPRTAVSRWWCSHSFTCVHVSGGLRVPVERFFS